MVVEYNMAESNNRRLHERQEDTSNDPSFDDDNSPPTSTQEDAAVNNAPPSSSDNNATPSSKASTPSSAPPQEEQTQSGMSSLPGAMYGATDPAKIPTDIFFPNYPTLGPQYLDDGGCLCALRDSPDRHSTAWRCFGNHTLDAYTGSGGQWFNIRDPQADWRALSINDAGNPPDLPDPMIEPTPQTDAALVPLKGISPNPLNIYDKACSGRNQSQWTTVYYRAEEQKNASQVPIAAAPCYQPGAVPIQIQNVTSWLQDGCLSGFYCPNNTINSLPQYCSPIKECLEARLAGTSCTLNNTNIGMGPFEPVVCTKGYFCPRGGKYQVKCPSGYYCPQGTVDPLKCTPGAICPSGSSAQYLILPLGLTAAFDILLVIVTLFLGWYFSMADHRSHRLHHLPTQMGMKERKGYGKLDDSDTEMVELDQGATGLRRRPTGFLGSLSGDAKSNMQMNMQASSELQAFVDSMRKAIQGSNFGLSFGFSQLNFHPKGVSKPVLQNISGGIRAGSLVGVMGGSGAGKCKPGRGLY